MRAMRIPVARSSGALSIAMLTLAAPVAAQTAPVGNGAPPADLSQTVVAPKGPGDAPNP